MSQAIETRYSPAGNVRGSRCTAKAKGGRCSVAWDNEIRDEENHARAAAKLAARLGWERWATHPENIHSGRIANGNTVHVYGEANK